MTGDGHYWNRECFEGLVALAHELRADRRLAELAEYCELREKGVRGPAFAALDRFIEATLALPETERREVVLRVLAAHERVPAAHTFLSQPLRARLVEPVLVQWSEAEPASAIPVTELGLLRRERVLLERALELDPSSERLRFGLAALDLAHVDFLTHHLVEGRLLGAPEDAESALVEAERLVSGVTQCERKVALLGEVASFRALLADFAEHSSDPRGAFPDWCRERGREHRFFHVVYYSSR